MEATCPQRRPFPKRPNPPPPESDRLQRSLLSTSAAAALAPTNGARSDVRILAERIDVSQKDEIDYMTRWLRERGEAVPALHAGHAMAGQTMPGHDMSAMSGGLMPGMLTAEQMAELKAAKGAEFDRLFLTFMIQHHQGAMTMVQELFNTPGAGQEINVWRFAADVEADQGSEIDRMRTMLAPRPPHDHSA